MKIKVPHKNYGVVELYETVAAAIGCPNPKKVQFDCRNVNVAKNLQDGFYNYYYELIKEFEHNITETESRAQTTVLLATIGPKVNENLADDEVEVFDGFIC